jgi:transcriptional regulator with XRE-family HTH domain
MTVKRRIVLMGYYSDNEQKEIISNNLTYLIELSGKDQKQISVELDVNPPTFNQWVNGKAIPSVSMLKRIAAYFGVMLTDLVDQRSSTSAPTDKANKLLGIIKTCNDEQLKLITEFAVLVTKNNYLNEKGD